MAKRTTKKEPKLLNNIVFRVFGILLILSCFAVVLSLVSYNPNDPSFNNITDAVPTNYLGSFGANLAVLTIDFGVALPIFLVAPIVWGYGFIRRREFLYAKSRIFAFSLGTILLSAFFGLLSISPSLGGDIGLGLAKYMILFAQMLGKTAGVSVVYFKTLIGFIIFSLSFMSFNFAVGITFRHWLQLMRLVAKSVMKFFGLFGGLFAKRSEQPVTEKRVRKTKERVEPKVKEEKAVKEPTVQRKVQKKMDGYNLPPVDLISLPKTKSVTGVSEKELDAVARNLEMVLQEFGVQGKIVKVRPGPVVTLYELEPSAGTKTARVIGLADDIARSMSVSSVRIAVVSGSNTIGIEMPNVKRETVWLRELFEDEHFQHSKNDLNIVLGKDIGGENVYADLAKMPHLLVAGTTGSGKSVGVNQMILSLLYKLSPDECKFIMIDPKMLEFSMYNGIPHLLTPVITDPGKAVVGLKWAVKEMEDRYRAMAKLNVRNITGYNQKLAELREKGEVVKRTVQTGFDMQTGKPIFEEQELDLSPLPYIVIVVDEMADLMLVAGKDVEAAIQRLAQMARAAGLHLIMSTQRPSVDVITGTIKANFPTRISFQVTSKIDSRTILGEQGAEQLLGRGDMLYMPAGRRPIRIHGSFVPDDEIERVVEFLKAQKEPEYVDDVTAGELTPQGDKGAVFDKGDMGGDGDLYQQAVDIVREDKKASISYIQRRLRIGYNKAASLIDRMEAEGVVSKGDHLGRREVLN